MEKDLKNKIAIVTGGAQGIGYQISYHFLKSGAKTIIILDILETTGADAAKSLNELFGEGKAVFIRCDVTKDLEEVSEEVISKYKVDIFVNNAGILNELSLRKTIEVNTIAVVEWGIKFWNYMRKDNGGSGGTIINVASIYGFECDPWVIYYKTSKHGVMGFTKSLGHAYNYNISGVRVFAICPGFTDTTILNANVFDYQKKDFLKFQQTVLIQKPESVGEAAVEIFKIAESGTAWIKKNEQPIEQVPM